MGFTGAVISDALEMQGASGAIGVPEAAVRALVAGNDLLCIGGEFPKAPDAEDLIEATIAGIVEAVHNGRISMERLEESAARTVLLGQPAVADPDAGPAEDLGVTVARRAVRIEGTLPADLDTALIVQLEPVASLAVGEVPWGLAGQLPGVQRVQFTDAGLVWGEQAARTTTEVAAALAARADGRPIVIVSRDTHRHPWARDLVETLSGRSTRVVLVEMGWPSPWRPIGVPAYVASYGASRANAAAVAELLGHTH